MDSVDVVPTSTNGTLSLPNRDSSARNLTTDTGDQFTFEGTAENIVVVGQIITMESESLVL